MHHSRLNTPISPAGTSTARSSSFWRCSSRTLRATWDSRCSIRRAARLLVALDTQLWSDGHHERRSFRACDCGALCIWCAWFRCEAAYRSLLHAAMMPNEERGCPRQCLEQWETLHYLTKEGGHDTSVADTLEYATADFALAQLAGDLHDDEEPRSTARSGAILEESLQSERHCRRRLSATTEPRRLVEGVRSNAGRRLCGRHWRSVPLDGAVQRRGTLSLIGGDRIACRRLDGFFHSSDGSWAFNAGSTSGYGQ